MIILKKIAQGLFIILLIVIFSLPLWIKTLPAKYISLLTGKLTIVDKVVCSFSTKISGESMSPVINPGSLVEMNRCFEDQDLTEGVIVLFNDHSNLRFGIIRHVLLLNPIVYKVSSEKAPASFHDVIKEEIVGITKNIDTSQSKYQAQLATESFILKANEFLSDFYLGKIQRGYGIEMAPVEKTNLFFKNKDKFCTVVVPKKEFIADIEIVNIETQEVVRSSKNIVYNLRPEPNINCGEFGSDPGMFDLDSGTYQYRLFTNHQVLEDVQFEVR